MRVLLDTNILISAFVFQSKHIVGIIDVLTEEHTIVIPTYVIAEMKMVVTEKFAHKSASLDRFLTNLPFELVYTPDAIDAAKYPAVRDSDDLPVLATAILENVDILLTGDKDFENLGLQRPAILTPAHFMLIYGK
ncbi:MAG: putative toxin-antitoxin system toxin component, PIN family [Deltaproteobacteria bacterium]|jgi:putative PIN family toxin of toxin-antitoxin system|nr:putative toxin-antitoxin system toxin component, PIN family [Deltaproteobacteria bacterium]